MNTAPIEPMGTESDAASLSALTDQLCQIAEAAPTHQLMLVALISTYKAIAVIHPCCTSMAAKAALQIGGELLVKSINETPTGSVH